ncbi:MAG: tRNA (5-methylaminomethyl-2-thiouridine)(34)-methyltransferase MnmD [Myxococcota bacterium]|nr:tRNA (5-methylaminomethyl-2-thiouridine)(34)-methyltransferase MnmD [Myxococcota bacterium]
MLPLDTLEIIETPDGSRTLRDPVNDVAFRSIRGAATESRHVFIEGSRILHQPRRWTIVELGLGTGLNFSQTVEAFLGKPDVSDLNYHAVEQSPLPPAVFNRLHPPTPRESPGISLLREALLSLENQPRQEQVSVQHDSGVTLSVYRRPWQETTLHGVLADASYHDPFAPGDNPECWTPNCFKWARAHLAPTGRLVTYSAASHVRRAMAEAGLYVAKAEGACGKREMTIASAQREALSHWKLLPPSKQPTPEQAP